MTAGVVASNCTVVALTGSAGTGKSTTLGFIIDALVAQGRGKMIILAAPTHPARKIAERSSGLTGKTVQSLLGRVYNREKGKSFPTGRIKFGPHHVVIVDEASMITAAEIAEILEVLDKGTGRLILVGDSSQLPPVQDSTGMFDEVTQAFGGEVFRLTESHRLAQDNPVLQIASRYRERGSVPPPLPKQEALTPDGRGYRVVPIEKALDELCERIAWNPDGQVRALAFTNGVVHQINDRVREYLYGPAAKTQPFMVGERVVSMDTDLEAGLQNMQEAVVLSAELLPGPYKLWSLNLRLDDPEPGQLAEIEVTAAAPGMRETLLDQITMKHAAALVAVAQLMQAMTGTPTSPSGADLISRAERMVLDTFEGDEELMKPVREAQLQGQSLKRVRKALDLRPPYAMTIHKSQGATVTTTYLHLGSFGSARSDEDYRALAYVGLTRSTDEVVLMT